MYRSKCPERLEMSDSPKELGLQATVGNLLWVL